MSNTRIINADSLHALKEIPNNSIDAVITDPPYGLSFMGKKWDYDVPSTEIWQECFRVLKPGGYLLAFAGTRTQHRMAVRIEDAGFEIRDMIAWVYGSGFPKSLNIGKAIDKIQGNERENLGFNPNSRPNQEGKQPLTMSGKFTYTNLTKGTSEWEGWGTALKPALEPITVARKPLSEKTVAENVLKWGVGGVNIDGCRVGTELMKETASDGTFKSSNNSMSGYNTGRYNTGRYNTGRFPANLIHDGSEEVLSLFPETKSGGTTTEGAINNWGNLRTPLNYIESNSGSASRFFYCAKASKSERNKGLEGMEAKGRQNALGELRQNHHPTVKPVKLMEYLIKLVTKENYTVLDPFMGSGSTGIACKRLNRNFIGIELSEEYCEIANKRIEAEKNLQ